MFNNIAYKFQNKKEAKMFVCPFDDCKKVYTLKNILLAHLRIHYGIKPFVCKYCSNSFNEKGNLKTHIRIHTGERPFKCKQCNKGFKALGQLTDHLISHTGFKPFQCPHCKKFYRRKEILKNHVNIHSKEEYFLDNKEKFQEMLNEVKQMKNFHLNFEDFNDKNSKKNDISISNSSLLSKEETNQNNQISSKTTSSCSDIIEEKERLLENMNCFGKDKKKEDEENFENNLSYFNKINNEYIFSDILYNDNFCYDWPNERNNNISNIMESLIIKDKNNYNSQKNDFISEKKSIYIKKNESENDMNIKLTKVSNFNFSLYDNKNIDNKNKYENDECSNMTNLYINEYENKKDIYELVNNI